MKVIVDIPDGCYKEINNGQFPVQDAYRLVAWIKNGKLLPKGHGRIVDIGKIDEDRIDSNNPVISLMINGEYIEAVSLDYLNNLEALVEADRGSE